MLIFNLFTVGFSLFCHSGAFVLGFFLFVKQRTVTERVRQRGKIETKSNVNKNTKSYLLCMEKGVSSADEKILKK